MSVEQSWTYDAPAGVYKNHSMSRDLRKAAIADTKFMQFVKPEPGYGKKKGESITITRISNIDEPTNGRIQEQHRIPEDEYNLSTKAITVSEWGRAVPYTSLAEDLGAFDLNNSIQMKLKDQMALTLDTGAADAFTSTDVKIKAVPSTANTITFSTNGVAGGAAASNLNLFHIEQIRDYMFSTLYVPPYENGDYIGLISTKAKRGLMSDPSWEDWKKYTDPSAKYNSEVGRMENIRFIEVNHSNALSNSIGTNGVLGEAVIFGADAVASAVAVDPELRAKTPEDFGRSKAVAWYGVLEFGVIWDTANAGEARIVHVSST